MVEDWGHRVAAWRAALARQQGQGMVEYGVILVLVAIVVLLLVMAVGHQTSTMYSNVSNSLG